MPRGSRQARLYRERQFARAALRQFGLPEARVHLLKFASPMLFFVDTEPRAILRLHPPDRHPFAAVQSELVWLQTLVQHYHLLVPQPLPTPDGQTLVAIQNAERTDVRYASLVRWVPGRRQVRHFSRCTVQRLGSTLAQLHDAAVRFQPPPGFARWDCLEDGVWDCVAGIARAGPPLLSREELRIAQDAFQQIDPTIRAYARTASTYGLIHGDTNLSNFLYQQGRVAIIDFEVCCFGPYLFDVTRTYNRVAA